MVDAQEKDAYINTFFVILLILINVNQKRNAMNGCIYFYVVVTYLYIQSFIFFFSSFLILAVSILRTLDPSHICSGLEQQVSLQHGFLPVHLSVSTDRLKPCISTSSLTICQV